MSWLRIEGKMPQHEKVAPLSDAAFRLHVTAKAWCVDHETDGFVKSKIPATLTAAPRGAALKKAIMELVESGLWEERDDGYQVHDFLKYNPSAAECAEQRASKAAAGAIGGRRSAQAKAEAKAKQAASTCLDSAQADGKQNSSPTPTPTPVPEGDPPTPLPVSGRAMRGLGFGAQHRTEVLQVRDEWMRIFGVKTHRFRDPTDIEAEHVSAAIDAYGLEKCLLALKYAPADGMVSGRDDDKKTKHESLGYIFGNNAALVRILRDAEQHEQAANDGSPSEKIARMKGQGAA